jgi:hypothetical protein
MKEIIFVTMGAAYGAVCLWLAVRIIDSREAWAKWTLAGLVLAAAFVWFLNGSLSPPLFDFGDHDFTAPNLPAVYPPANPASNGP